MMRRAAARVEPPPPLLRAAAASNGRPFKPKRTRFSSVMWVFSLLLVGALGFYWMTTGRDFSLHNDDEERHLIQQAPPLLAVAAANSGVVQLHECSIPHYSLDGTAPDSTQQPVILSGWNIPQWMASERTFLKNHASTPFYIKDTAVQIKSPNCVLSFQSLWNYIINFSADNDLPMAFTNDHENRGFFSKIPAFDIPTILKHISGFSVFSVLTNHQSHAFHKHGESWIGSAAGYKVWWFLPPDTNPPPPRVNACLYLTQQQTPPPNTTTCLQSPGTIIWFPKDWYHATCALSEWTVGIGKQQGPLIRQQFPPLPEMISTSDTQDVSQLMKQCLPPNKSSDWKWYDGNLTQYYNDLEKDHKRNPTDVSKYAVHRWMGEKRSTTIHYELIHNAITRLNKKSAPISVLDAGCGLGSALMWMEQHEPAWTLHGRTISDEQLRFIEKELPQHKFQVKLQSYDELDNDEKFESIYSIEALIHSTDISKTFQTWAEHLVPGGTIVIIDDFLSPGVDRSESDVDLFCKSWLANSLVTTVELHAIARRFGMDLVESRDLLAEYRIVELNYRNSIPKMDPDRNKNHQGWMGSKLRQKLTVEGKLGYNMVVFRKKGGAVATSDEQCASVPSSGGATVSFSRIVPKDECLSGWYCCDFGSKYMDQLAANRTHNYGYLKLDKKLFGNYMNVFAKHLNEFYETLPSGHQGRFLDIGATGSTSSGMKQVTSKFAHFAGPLSYWMLDSDTGAKSLEHTIYCDVCDCPGAPDCGFEVTFSHTVLEHASHPDKAFDTVARTTKKGGLTMHLVPWSYQYHATPDDFYRFSHSALKVLLEDRGFEVLEVGYDLCSRPDSAKKNLDGHFELIWLTYVVGRKK